MTSTRLAAEGLTLAYGDRVVCDELSVQIPDGALTAIIGPNGCGKSTLLKALGRVLTPRAGTVRIDGRPLASLNRKEAARLVAMLPQGPTVPEQITVRDLIGRGRYPYHSLMRQWSPEDEGAIADAIQRAGVSDLTERQVSELSGGQRQRVWIAMVLAQTTPVLLLDEPTTYLDIAHQYDVLELCGRLRDTGTTIAAVLHDLNQAARYADHLIVMQDGRIMAEGPAADVLTAELVRDVFHLPCQIAPDPQTGTPMVVPHAHIAAASH